MSATSAAHGVTGDAATRLDYAAAMIPPLTLSECLAMRIGNYRATRGGEALRAEFDRFCSRLYWCMAERDPDTASEFRAGLNRRLRDAGEREIVWTRE